MIRPLALCLALLAAPALAQDPDLDAWTARTAVEDYFAAIDAGGYAAAWAMWDDGGAASGQTAAAFAEGFDETGAVAVFTGPLLSMEGAAGSIYANVPVRIEAELKDGTAQHFAGTFVMRRANGVPGADPGWRISAADVAPE
ncbi:hypothetical protein [Wenxinia marina]|uniref:Nuclear transport factor 2 family protein n=1 Tax=Wenxinia marina DSM 24838 TaxID=1123501 RepID=A0A0D0NT11_9RHOB|nr:hypothetical protein [Wenxinia marina]KIQ71340.1 hypothetical protein Wenmar_00110 [Wenxinia marina DSM 24838]